MKLGIVVSQTYWDKIMKEMLTIAEQTAQKHKVETETIKVPGSFDIPLAVKKLLKKQNIDGVITLGTIIKGETAHDEIIAYTVAEAITNLSLEFEKPVVLGVNGPKMSAEQAVARIPRAAKVTEACIQLIKELN